MKGSGRDSVRPRTKGRQKAVITVGMHRKAEAERSSKDEKRRRRGAGCAQRRLPKSPEDSRTHRDGEELVAHRECGELWRTHRDEAAHHTVGLSAGQPAPVDRVVRVGGHLCERQPVARHNGEGCQKKRAADGRNGRRRTHIQTHAMSNHARQTHHTQHHTRSVHVICACDCACECACDLCMRLRMRVCMRLCMRLCM